MRYLWLIGVLTVGFGSVHAVSGDDAPRAQDDSQAFATSASLQEDNPLRKKPRSPSRSNEEQNKPRPAENRSGNDPQPANAPSNTQDDNPLRKKPRESDAGGVRSSNAPQRDEGRVPLEGRRVPLEARPVPFESRPVLTPPSSAQVQNRPVPIEGGDLPALVREVEGLNPYRWRDRYVLVPIDPAYTHSGFYVEYRLGNFRFGYRYYYTYPDPFRVVYAPYWYYDPCPPFVVVYRVVYMPPRPHTVLVEVPIYVESPYYLERRPLDDRQRLLSDLRAAWMLRDPSFLERYIRPNSYIAIYLDGQYAYSLPAQDYIEMTRDAIRAVKTEQIRFDRITRRGDTQLVVRGEHQYLDEATGVRRIVYIHYTFERVDDRWYLIEAGSSASRR